MQQNCIQHISGLEELANLDTLNISQNQIRKLEGLSCCPSLRTLICTNNQLAGVDSLRHLAECKGLHTLDLQNNNISDPAIVDQVLVHLPELRCAHPEGAGRLCRLRRQGRQRGSSSVCHSCCACRAARRRRGSGCFPCSPATRLRAGIPHSRRTNQVGRHARETPRRCLYLKGNPVVSQIKNYRKALVAALPELRYLDDRPVFEDERRIVNAWCARCGGEVAVGPGRPKCAGAPGARVSAASRRCTP